MSLSGKVACVAVVAMFLFIDTRLANQPDDGPHEDNAVAFMGAARNHLRYGLSRTLGQDLQEPHTGWYGDLTVEHRYLHHPPGLSLTLAAAIFTFGDTRATGRLTAAAFTLASLLAVMTGAYRVFGTPWASAFAGACFTLTPLSAFFGRSVDYQTFTLPFILWSQVLMIVYRQSNRLSVRNVAIAVACVGGLYDWDIYFWILTAGLYEWIWPRSGVSRWRAMRPWAVAGASTFIACVAQILWIAGSSQELLNVLLRWIDGTGKTVPAGAVDAGRALGWFATVFNRHWLLAEIRVVHSDFTGPLLLVAVAWSALAMRRAVRRWHLSDAERLIALSTCSGLFYVLAIPAAAFHQYAFMPVLGAVCWAGTAAVFRLARPARAWAGAALLLGVWWAAGPWVTMYFGACFPPYGVAGRCDRPVTFSGFGRITYPMPPRHPE